jgi:hypothetical protein
MPKLIDFYRRPPFTPWVRFCSSWGMDCSKALKILGSLLIANVALVSIFLLSLHSEPEHHISLSSQRNALLIFGKNSYGTLSIRIFKNWKEANSYLQSRNLSLPNISYAQPGVTTSVIVKRSQDQQKPMYFRVFWQPNSGDATLDSHSEILKLVSNPPAELEKLPVIHAPDSETALKFFEYLRYTQHVSQSVFGFSVPVVRDSAL